MFAWLKSKDNLSRLVASLLFVGAGIMHFVSPRFYLKIMPVGIPRGLELVYFTGVLEILGGIGLWLPKTRRAAAYGLGALLVAVFPANVNHAVSNVEFGGFTDSPVYHWIRLPLQGVLIWWMLQLAKGANHPPPY